MALMFKSLFTDEHFSIEPDGAEMQASRRVANIMRARGDSDSVVDISISGRISLDLALDVFEELQKVRASRQINLVINSAGGDCYAAVFIHSIIRAHAAERKTARILGSCKSAALIVALAADYRVALRRSEFLLHPSRTELSASQGWTAAEFQSQADYLREIDNDMIDLIARRSGADRSVVAAEAGNEEPTSVEWCIRNGIIHEITEDQS